jgi:ketosteroid isomerase-like protein
MAAHLGAGPPDATDPVGALRRLLAAVVAREAHEIVDSYADRSDLLVYVEGPRWQTVGHEAVARGWRDFCTSGLWLRRVDFTDGPHVHACEAPEAQPSHAPLACLSGTVELDVVRPTGTQALVPMRMTWVMVREPDRWRIVHEHASQPLVDPYGTGDWLRSEDGP